MNIESLTPNQCLQKFLMCSYLYYIRFISVIDDHEFDSLTQKLLKAFDEVEHQHKYLVTEEDLKAGTLYGLRQEDYPMMVKQAAEIWARDHFTETT